MSTDISAELLDGIFRLIVEFSDSYFKFKDYYSTHYEDPSAKKLRMAQQLLNLDMISKQNLTNLSEFHRNFEINDRIIANLDQRNSLQALFININENFDLIHEVIGTPHDSTKVINKILTSLERIPIGS